MGIYLRRGLQKSSNPAYLEFCIQSNPEQLTENALFLFRPFMEYIIHAVGCAVQVFGVAEEDYTGEMDLEKEFDRLWKEYKRDNPS